jgi:integrase/recombinase XerD
MDTGARAAEFVAIGIEDIEMTTGAVLIRHGKGRKPRTVFIGKKSRRAVRKWLRLRGTEPGALWLNVHGERLTYWGLRQVMRRRGEQAGIDKTPSLHSFRRLFALSMLRNGTDIYSLQALMGHADLQMLRRYLAQTTQDLQEAHRRGSPVDNAGY